MQRPVARFRALLLFFFFFFFFFFVFLSFLPSYFSTDLRAALTGSPSLFPLAERWLDARNRASPCTYAKDGIGQRTTATRLPFRRRCHEEAHRKHRKPISRIFIAAPLSPQRAAVFLFRAGLTYLPTLLAASRQWLIWIPRRIFSTSRRVSCSPGLSFLLVLFRG